LHGGAAIADELAGRPVLDDEQPEPVALVSLELPLDPSSGAGTVEGRRVVAHRARVTEHREQRVEVAGVVVEGAQTQALGLDRGRQAHGRPA
jgi:hypothetical protein